MKFEVLNCCLYAQLATQLAIPTVLLVTQYEPLLHYYKVMHVVIHFLLDISDVKFNDLIVESIQ